MGCVNEYSWPIKGFINPSTRTISSSCVLALVHFSRGLSVIKKSVSDQSFTDAMATVQVAIDYRDAPEFKTFFDADYKRLAGGVKAIGRLEEHR